MSTEEKNVVQNEEPKMCTKREQVGHALGVLGHDSAYNLWSSWMMPFMKRDILWKVSCSATSRGRTR